MDKKIISNEFVTIENYKTYKIIEIVRQNKIIYTIKTTDLTMNLKDLKRKYRFGNKILQANNKLTIIDDENLCYNYQYNQAFNNIVDNYIKYKKLLEYLQKTKSNTITCQSNDGYKKEYHKNFKIVYNGGF